MRPGDLDHLMVKLDAELCDDARYIDIRDQIADIIESEESVEPFDYIVAERAKARQRGYEDGYHTGMEIGKTLNPKIKRGK